MKARHKRIIGWSLAVASAAAFFIILSKAYGHRAIISAFLVAFGIMAIVYLILDLIFAEDNA